jgi:hypothetical protein
MTILLTQGLTTRNRVRLVPASLPSPISGERRAAPPGTRLNPRLCLLQRQTRWK